MRHVRFHRTLADEMASLCLGTDLSTQHTTSTSGNKKNSGKVKCPKAETPSGYPHWSCDCGFFETSDTFHKRNCGTILGSRSNHSGKPKLNTHKYLQTNNL